MVSCDNFCSCEVKLREKYALPPLFAMAREVRTWRDKLGLVKYLPFLLTSGKWGKVTNFQFAERLCNPFLRAAFHALFQGREMGIMALAPQLAWFDQKCVAFPIGGSRQFAQRIAKRYESLGGVLHLGAPVRRILVEDDRAVGVELEEGQRHAAGKVISAADGRWTIFEALGGRYVDAAIWDLYDGKTVDLSDAVILVSLDVARTFEREPWLFRFPLADPLVLPDGTRHERMNTHIYNHPSAPSSFTLHFCLLWRIFRLPVAMNWAIDWVRSFSWDGWPSASNCGRKEAKHSKIGLIM